MRRTKAKKLPCVVGDVVLVAYNDVMPRVLVVTEITEHGTDGHGLDIAGIADLEHDGRAYIDSAEQVVHNFGRLDQLLAPTLMLNKGRDPSRPRPPRSI